MGFPLMTNCLQLRIPPLPQFLTIGFSIWRIGAQHFGRTFDVYDLLFVRSGMLHMTEGAYALMWAPAECCCSNLASRTSAIKLARSRPRFTGSILSIMLLSQLQASLRSGRLSSRSSVIAAQVMLYLEVRLREPYHTAHMEDELHFNEDYAARCLRKHTGLSPLQYHHVLRMEEAK